MFIVGGKFGAAEGGCVFVVEVNMCYEKASLVPSEAKISSRRRICLPLEADMCRCQ